MVQSAKNRAQTGLGRLNDNFRKVIAGFDYLPKHRPIVKPARMATVK